jgi:hypothetical protein
LQYRNLMRIRRRLRMTARMGRKRGVTEIDNWSFCISVRQSMQCIYFLDVLLSCSERAQQLQYSLILESYISCKADSILL